VSGGALETVEIEAKAADAAVVLMHGLGADGHDFESLVPELRLPASPSVRWVFPHAPVRPVTLNGGHRMRAWYDIVAIDRRAAEDEAGVRQSADTIGALVRRERDRGIAAERIVLAGFSQGGAMALFTALRWPERLGGVVALSCYLPLAASLAAEAHPANAALSVFMAHGTVDPIVPTSLGERSRDLLLSRGYDVEWHTYPMPHSVSAPEVADLRKWLLRAVPPLRACPGPPAS
jgi:phospholipase/carboxylesterase